MKSILFFLLFSTVNAFASWHYNTDGGFGFYQPEGWTVEQDWRLSYLTGPAKDSKQSKFLMGSDWIGNVLTLEDLKIELKSKYPDLEMTEVKISGVSGFQVTIKKFTEIYLFRQKQNVMLIRYIMQGSQQQLDEANEVLSSIEVSTKPIN